MPLASKIPSLHHDTDSPGGLPIGSILGSLTLPDHVVQHSTTLAAEFFAAAEESDFNEQVETYCVPVWAKRHGVTWLPELAALGFRRAGSRNGRNEQIVATAGVDMHTDGEGLVLMIVLHNDGLTFRQGKVRHQPKAGDWFIFDDRKPHGVKEAAGRASFLAWNIPITAK